MTDVPPAVVYTRVSDVVWRLAPDRVLLRHVGAGPFADAGTTIRATTIRANTYVDDGVAADLIGLAALVWVALDEPGTASEVAGRLDEADISRAVEEVDDVARQLVAAGWVRAVEAGT